MSEALESYEGYQQRGVRRCQVLIDTRLRMGNEMYPFEVLNISTAGLMGTCALTLFIGAIVEIDLPGTGFVDAHIRWALAGQVGMQLVTPLTLDQCRHAILPDPTDL